MSKLTSLLDKLKSLRLKNANSNLWIVQRSKDALAPYNVKSVSTDKQLQSKMKEVVIQSIQNCKEIHDYHYNAHREDGDVLFLEGEGTDFPSLSKQMSKGFDSLKVTQIEELLQAWAYIIELRNYNGRVFAFKKIIDGWSVEKQNTLSNMIFQKQMLVDIDKEKVFKIYATVDFIVHANRLFILDKYYFEMGMNYRAALERNKYQVLKEFDKLGIFEDANLIEETVGSNLRYLRKLALIKHNGYYKDDQYMGLLRAAIDSNPGWGVTLQNGKIKVTPDNVDVVLKLVNNDRLKSIINDEVFDALVKEKVELRAKALMRRVA